MVTRADVVATARSYIGTPYHHMGRAPGMGLDCGGIIVCVGRELGIFAPDFDVPPYTRSPDAVTLLAWCRLYLREIDKDTMQPGDIIMLITDVYPQHLGILGRWEYGGKSAPLSIIHSTNSRSVVPPRVIEMRLMFSRNQRFVAAFSFPGVE